MFLRIRSSVYPTFSGILVSGPLQFKCRNAHWVFEFSTQLDALSKCPQYSGEDVIIFKFSWESHPRIILRETE